MRCTRSLRPAAQCCSPAPVSARCRPLTVIVVGQRLDDEIVQSRHGHQRHLLGHWRCTHAEQSRLHVGHGSGIEGGQTGRRAGKATSRVRRTGSSGGRGASRCRSSACSSTKRMQSDWRCGHSDTAAVFPDGGLRLLRGCAAGLAGRGVEVLRAAAGTSRGSRRRRARQCAARL